MAEIWMTATHLIGCWMIGWWGGKAAFYAFKKLKGE